MVHNSFNLKRSQLLITFQIIFFIIITILLFKTLSFLIFLFTFLTAFLFLYLFIKNTQLFSLYHLDGNEWTLFVENENKTESIHIDRIINHYLYIVIYTDSSQYKPLIIWCDQLSKQQWKNLVVLAKII